MVSLDEIRAKKRAENAESNAVAIGLVAALSVKATPKPKAKAAPRKRPATEALPVRSQPSRKSARASRLSEEDREKQEQEEAAQAAAEEAERSKLKHGDRDIEVASSVSASQDQASLRELFRELAAESLLKLPTPPTSSPLKASRKKGKPEAFDLNAVKKELEAVELRAVVRLLPDRIYTGVVHPSPTRDIVFLGDKTGHVGVIEVSPGCAQGEEDQNSRHWYWQAHSRTISHLKFSPTDCSKLYSSSYDCTLRCTDLRTGVSTEILDMARFDDDDSLIHSFDLTPDGNKIFATDHHGGLTWRDLREPIEYAKRWKLDDYKIGCFGLNPVNPGLGVTSHLKRSVKLWDLVKLRGTPPDGTPEQIQACVLAEYQPGKAATSAYFSSNGQNLLSTSYDDTIRVWDIDPKDTSSAAFDPFDPADNIDHDCQTGAYVSVFKARWVDWPSAPSALFSVGSMSRTINIITKEGTVLKKLTGDSVTSVPAITLSHPTRSGRFWGGTSYGKVQFYSA